MDCSLHVHFWTSCSCSLHVLDCSLHVHFMSWPWVNFVPRLFARRSLTRLKSLDTRLAMSARRTLSHAHWSLTPYSAEIKWLPNISILSGLLNVRAKYYELYLYIYGEVYHAKNSIWGLVNNVRFVGLEVTDKKWTIVIKFIYSEISEMYSIVL